jgi:hypothetical protein
MYSGKIAVPPGGGGIRKNNDEEKKSARVQWCPCGVALTNIILSILLLLSCLLIIYLLFHQFARLLVCIKTALKTFLLHTFNFPLYVYTVCF